MRAPPVSPSSRLLRCLPQRPLTRPGPTPSFTHVGRKQSLPSPLPKLLKTSARWDVATIKAPDMAGQLGGTGGEGGFAVDLGKFHLSLPRLQATLEV